MDTITLSAPIELDDDGYWDRQCPGQKCGRAFRVHFEDWKSKVPDNVARCAFCGHVAEPSDFNTPEQTEYLQRIALAEVRLQLGKMFKDVARGFNRRMPKRGVVTMRMDVSSPPAYIPLQPAAEELMTLRITCEQCGCRFAVFGAGSCVRRADTTLPTTPSTGPWPLRVTLFKLSLGFCEIWVQ